MLAWRVALQAAALLLMALLVAPTALWALEPAGVALSSESAAAPAAASLQAGQQLFEAHCLGCHVGGGNIIRRGRTLKLEALQRAGLADPEAIARVAAEGLGQMSGYAAVLGDGGPRLVADWVWLQAQAGWPRAPRLEALPGR